MKESKEFYVNLENIIAFSKILQEGDLQNGIGHVLGDDGLSITVWYFKGDDTDEELIKRLEAFDE
jgi:hypothetical protein